MKQWVRGAGKAVKKQVVLDRCATRFALGRKPDANRPPVAELVGQALVLVSTSPIGAGRMVLAWEVLAWGRGQLATLLQEHVWCKRQGL